MVPPPLLAISDLSLTYPGGVRALDRVDLTVAAGDFLSIVGPSGCGKSTLLRLVAGLLGGADGRITWGWTVARGDVGFVFQDPTLMPWARVLENVRLPLDLAGVPRRLGDERALEQLRRVGLADFARAYPRTLSGGMRMRVSLARALVTKPRLLLLDEPFAALDEITRFRLNDDLLELWRAVGVTCLFVTHSVFEAVYLSRRVAVMSPRPGRITAEIPVELPSVRDSGLRMSPGFADVCRSVSERLAEVMGVPA